MNAVNSKNVCFLIMFLVILGISFGVIQVIGKTDISSIYTQLFYGNEKVD